MIIERSWPRGFAPLLCLWGQAMVLLTAGCAGTSPEQGLREISNAASQRTGIEIAWSHDSADEQQIRDQVAAMLATELSADSAARIAVLNNRRMRAIYQNLGIAQADLAQAGLLSNPVLDISYVGTTHHLRNPELEVATVFGFLDLLTLPLRKRMAAEHFEAAKLEVTQQVLALVAETRAQFHIVQADEQRIAMFKQVLEATSASVEVARRLHEAGNLRSVDLDNEIMFDAEARMDWAAAELAARKNRERLNILMGLWGQDAVLKISSRLPEIPQDELSSEDVEKHVIEANLDLQILRHRLRAANQALGYTRATALVPEIEVGGVVTRTPEDSSLWGTMLALPLPLFDWGRFRLARAQAEIRRLQEEFYHKAVETLAAARAARDHLQLARDRAIYTRDFVVPLQHRILVETQRNYNAMQVGVFHLLSAKRAEIAAGKRYVEDLRDYWLARTEMESLLSGHVTSVGFETTALDATMGSALH